MTCMTEWCSLGSSKLSLYVHNLLKLFCLECLSNNFSGNFNTILNISKYFIPFSDCKILLTGWI